MTKTGKRVAGKAGAKQLKLKKETIRDLDAKGKGIKGGFRRGLDTPATDVACSRGACGPTWGAGCSDGCQTISVELCVKR